MHTDQSGNSHQVQQHAQSSTFCVVKTVAGDDPLQLEHSFCHGRCIEHRSRLSNLSLHASNLTSITLPKRLTVKRKRCGSVLMLLPMTSQQSSIHEQVTEGASISMGSPLGQPEHAGQRLTETAPALAEHEHFLPLSAKWWCIHGQLHCLSLFATVPPWASLQFLWGLMAEWTTMAYQAFLEAVLQLTMRPLMRNGATSACCRSCCTRC